MSLFIKLACAAVRASAYCQRKSLQFRDYAVQCKLQSLYRKSATLDKASFDANAAMAVAAENAKVEEARAVELARQHRINAVDEARVTAGARLGSIETKRRKLLASIESARKAAGWAE